MPENPYSPTSRAIGILFASGLLIAFAGLAGLGATAISVASASGEDALSQPAQRADRAPARIHAGRRYAAPSARIVSLRRYASGDSAAREGKAGILPGHSVFPAAPPVVAAPLAEYDEDPR